MSKEAKPIVVTEHPCEVCGTETVLVSHQAFPELRVSGSSAESAARQLVQKLETNLGAVTDPEHRQPVEQAIADLRNFVDREGNAEPEPGS